MIGEKCQNNQYQTNIYKYNIELILKDTIGFSCTFGVLKKKSTDNDFLLGHEMKKNKKILCPKKSLYC